MRVLYLTLHRTECNVDMNTLAPKARDDGKRKSSSSRPWYRSNSGTTTPWLRDADSQQMAIHVACHCHAVSTRYCRGESCLDSHFQVEPPPAGSKRSHAGMGCGRVADCGPKTDRGSDQWNPQLCMRSLIFCPSLTGLVTVRSRNGQGIQCPVLLHSVNIARLGRGKSRWGIKSGTPPPSSAPVGQSRHITLLRRALGERRTTACRPAPAIVRIEESVPRIWRGRTGAER